MLSRYTLMSLSHNLISVLSLSCLFALCVCHCIFSHFPRSLSSCVLTARCWAIMFLSHRILKFLSLPCPSLMFLSIIYLSDYIFPTDSTCPLSCFHFHHAFSLSCCSENCTPLLVRLLSLGYKNEVMMPILMLLWSSVSSMTLEIVHQTPRSHHTEGREPFGWTCPPQEKQHLSRRV